MSRVAMVLGAVAALAAGLANAAWRAGTVSGAELGLPSGAFSASLGRVSAGLCESASAVSANPARMGAGQGMTGTYTAWPAGLSDASLAGCTAMGPAGTVGIFLRRLWMTSDRLGENGDGSYGGPNGRVGMQTSMGEVAWSPDPGALTDLAGRRVSLGASFSVIERDLDDASQRGISGTLGADMDLSANIRAFGVARELGQVSKRSLPLEGTAGVVWSTGLPETGVIRLAGAGTWGADGGPSASVGAEAAFGAGVATAAVRAGYRIGGIKQAGYLPYGGLSLGLGALSLELAVVPMGDIGTAQIASLSYVVR